MQIARKRMHKACDRCRLKKLKCGGAEPCDRCIQDNAICVFGQRKKSHDNVYPKGYVEMLEQQHSQLIAGLRELYRRLQARESWPGAPLECVHNGQPLTHDILERLGLLYSSPDSPIKQEGFEEDLGCLQQRLIDSGAPLVQRRGLMSLGSDAGLAGDPFPDPSEMPNSGRPLLNSLENTFLGNHFSQSQQTTTDFELATPLTQSYNQAQDQAYESPTPVYNYHAMRTMDFNGFTNANGTVTQAVQSEVLNAASILNGHIFRGPHMVSDMEFIHAPSIVPAAVSTPYSPLQSAPASSLDVVFGFPQSVAASELLNTSVSTTHDFTFSGPHAAPPHPSSGEEYNSRLYSFTSDGYFAGNGFQAQNNSEKCEMIEKNILRDLFIVQPTTHSADNTRAPTPELIESRKKSVALHDDEEESKEDSLQKKRKAESSNDERTPTRRTSQANFKARQISPRDNTEQRRSSATAA